MVIRSVSLKAITLIMTSSICAKMCILQEKKCVIVKNAQGSAMAVRNPIRVDYEDKMSCQSTETQLCPTGLLPSEREMLSFCIASAHCCEDNLIVRENGRCCCFILCTMTGEDGHLCTSKGE